MAEYKGIKGFQVQTRTEDPSEGIAGDFYYNSTSGEFKTIIPFFEAKPLRDLICAS